MTLSNQLLSSLLLSAFLGPPVLSGCGKVSSAAFCDEDKPCDTNQTCNLVSNACETVIEADASLADAQSILPDAGACNPVTQLGCANDEKCGELTLSFKPLVVETTCIPNGSASLGQSCTDGPVGATTGFDDCSAGLDCFQGDCQEICSSNPNSCTQSFPCEVNFENHFTDEIGVCIPTCVPTDDTVLSGIAVNNTCGAGSSCGLNAITANTSCAAIPPMSATQTQNDIPFGPGGGAPAYNNGCASGFSILLNERVGSVAGDPQCTRFCTPANTYRSLAGPSVGAATGLAGKCLDSALDELGGRNGNNSPHQCRFIQSFYVNTNLVPATIGMCVPVLSSGGGENQLSNGATGGPTFGDCNLFEWELLRDSWNSAAPNGAVAAEMAFDNFCLTNPSDPAISGILDRCFGFFHGCLSLEMRDEMLAPAAASSFSLSNFGARYEDNLKQKAALIR